MRKTKEIKREIEDLRNHLYYLIGQKKNLITPEVVIVSQKLDRVLNEYDITIKKQIA
ncbi:aspartyl-phosphate phosphatase Spo0E family protein [Inediibacterium massiliense]|uniref:aspartyl-phosphate phosphatase Spo0E family protein n=1 Tax=Inediibacterium massiliense TaxID=1658111 RepID=UPI000DA60EA4|nr:aspartyl-phosphate phosphatase Spo0E family protein [Inediibacterium massiliense]